MGPPKILSLSSTIRVSATMRITLSFSSVAITGSRLTNASICPARIAATAAADAPTPIKETSLGSMPALRRMKMAIACELEPGAVTPIFLPLSSANDLKSGIVLLLTAKTHCGALPCRTNACIAWPRACIDKVCSKAPDTTSAEPPTTACKEREPP